MDNQTLDAASEQRLLDAARSARSRAYAPYSGFRVGAAVMDSEGRIAIGCNVENASYGLGVCAERNAVAAAVAAGATRLVAVLVASQTTPGVTPCGACRQVLAEFGDPLVLVAGDGGVDRRLRLSQLLPVAFGPNDLDRRA